jgi:transposase
MYHVEQKGFKTIARKLNISKNTVKEVIRNDKTLKKYKRNHQPYPMLNDFVEVLTEKLEVDALEPKYRRRTAKKLYEEIHERGFKGSYTTVNNFVRRWKKENHLEGRTAFVPMEFAPGEAFQFDWSEEEIKLKGELVSVKVAHIRLCYSRLFLIVVYRNEQLEMVMDAHDEAFKFFEGCARKGIYDNMKTVVQKVLLGKSRKFNQRFLEMASHYLFEPAACTPGAGWEKGQVENQVHTSRNNFFTPLRCVESLEEFNAQLKAECLAWAKKSKHPEFKNETVWEIYEKEKSSLIAYRYPFEAYQLKALVVNSTSLVQYETNGYSVYVEYVGMAVEVRIYAERIIIIHKEKVIGEHKRCFERYKRIYNPLHYLSVLERKPGALRNGAPFKEWTLSDVLKQLQHKLEKYEDGEKQFIQILNEIAAHGLANVEKACSHVLSQGTYNLDFVQRYLNGKEEDKDIVETYELILKDPPDSECSYYTTALLNKASTKGENNHVV